MIISAASIVDVATSVDTLWILLGIVLIFFMQAGFAMVETGFTRAKNAGNIMMKNLMDFAIGSLVFWLFGYGLMQGADAGGVIGTPVNPFGTYDWQNLMFHMVFCATAATIVSGAMAERTKFSSYCIYSAVISMLIYPISGHWIWGGGFLSQLGFTDFAGSCAVHMLGGVAALVGAKILGPRIGKYTVKSDGKLSVNAIPGHNIPLGALGVFILWFAWYGFNGSSTYAFDLENSILASKVLVTTTVAASTASVATLIITWIRYKKPDVSMTLNGALAGLVAITAGCASVSPAGAFIIGLIAAFAVVFAVEFIDKKLHIDDPVGAIAVHGVCGAIGTILTGVFSQTSGIISGFIYNDELTAGEAFRYFGVQILGVVCTALWCTAMATAVFLLIKNTIGLRASKKAEIIGLDISEHGLVSSYPDFVPAIAESLNASAPADTTVPAPVEDAVPIKRVSKTYGDGPKISKVVVLASPDRFDALKDALNAIGVTGLTVTNVAGCGVQKGYTDSYYRGVKVGMRLLPKMKVEVVVSKVPVETVTEAAKKALYTGNFGDGKIFVYDVEDVERIRTGEHGFDALQDPEE